MTYRKLLAAMSLAALSMAPLAAAAQINSPEAGGYLARAVAMMADNNARGTIDQSLRAMALYPTDAQKQSAEYLMAMAALRERDASAPTLLEGFAQAYPETVAALAARMAAADWYFAKRDYAAALSRYAALDPSGFDDADAAALRFRHALCLMMTGDYEPARNLFSQVADSKAAGEYGPASVFYLGYMAYRDGNVDEALRRFEAAAKADPSLAAAANVYTAQLLYARGDNERALAAARKTIKTPEGPFHSEARRIAGEALYNLGRSDEAVPLLWVYAQAVDQPAPSALYILGVDEYRQGHYSEASSLLSRVATDPSAMGQSASLMLGQAYLQADRTDAALMAFERAMNAGYDSQVAETAAYNHAVATINGARLPFASSVTSLEAFLKKYPNSEYAPEIQKYIVNGYMTDRNYEAALASIDGLANPSADILKARQRVVYALGSREYGEGKYASARKYFNQAATAGADPAISRSATLWQGLSEMALENYGEAADRLNAFLKTAPAGDPDRATANYNLGYALWGSEKYGEAAAAFARVSSDGAVATRLRSDALSRQGDAAFLNSDFAAASGHYGRAYELAPSSADYPLYQQAIMKGLQRDHKTKITLLERFASEFPSSALLPDALLEKAESQVALGNTSAAIVTYESLAEQFPATAAARQGRLRMAVTRLNAGDTDRAIADYKAVIAAYPSSTEARTALDDLKNIYGDRGNVEELSQWLVTVDGAPALDPSDLERMTFAAAEKEYMAEDKTTRLSAYLHDYPKGANYPRALFYMAEAAALAGDYDTAYKYASLLLADYPDADTAPDALLIRADAEAAGGKTEAALESYTTLASRAASPAQLALARMGILRAATSLERNERALSAADELLASTAAGASANRNEVMMLRGLALDRLGRHDEAYAQWTELIAAAPDDVNAARAAVEHSSSLFASGKTADAHRRIDSFINTNPASQYWLARAFILLSDILRTEGNDFEADEYLISLRNNYPGTEADILQMIDTRLTK